MWVVCTGPEGARCRRCECRKPRIGAGLPRRSAAHPGHGRHAVHRADDEDRTLQTLQRQGHHARTGSWRGRLSTAANVWCLHYWQLYSWLERPIKASLTFIVTRARRLSTW